MMLPPTCAVLSLLHQPEDLFEPPSLAEPVTRAGALLAELSHDIGSVPAIADTVPELDPLQAAANAP